MDFECLPDEKFVSLLAADQRKGGWR